MPSRRIVGARRRDDTIVRVGGTGDSWPMTWGPGDRLHTVMNDGYGWTDERPPGSPGGMYNNRVIALEGGGDAGPRGLRPVWLPGYPDLFFDALPQRFYGFGILSVRGRLVVALSACDRPLGTAEGARWIGVKLIASDDGGATWVNQDGSAPVRWEEHAEQSRATMLFHGEPDGAFSILTFLQAGRDYAQNRDGYVYAHSPNGNADGTMNQLVLTRAPIDGVLDRSRYEFFAGLGDGEARWSRDPDDREALIEFPRGWMNRTAFPWSWVPSTAYHPALDRYLLAAWGTSPKPDGGWFEHASYLGLWSAPAPWGPWEQFHEERAWLPGGDPAARAYAPQILPRWMGDDGSFWIAWSDFAGADSPVLELPPGHDVAAAMAAWRAAMPGYSLTLQRIDLDLDLA